MIIANNEHILNINESHFSDEYQHIIRKLREAHESKQVREEMQMEDDFISELRINAEIIAEQDKSLAEKDKIIAENEKSLEEKDKIIEELKRLIGK